MARIDGRSADQLRPVTLTRNWLDHAAGLGAGRVREDPGAVRRVRRPRACRAGARAPGSAGSPRSTPCSRASTNTRSDRESVKGRIGGRTHEISRLIGRSLRAVIDYKALGENTILLDCDVLQADGGTRTAAITGAYVALADAVAHLRGARAAHGRAADRLGGRGLGRHHRRRARGSTSPTRRTSAPRPT